MTILPKSKAGTAVKKSAPRDNSNSASFDGQSVPGSSSNSGWVSGVVGSAAGSGWSPGGPPVPGPSSSPRWSNVPGGGTPVSVEVNANSKKRSAPQVVGSQSQSSGFFGSYSERDDLDRLGGPTKRGRRLVTNANNMTVGSGSSIGAGNNDDVGMIVAESDANSKSDPSLVRDGDGGYNSEDEYSHYGVQMTEEEWVEKDRRFERAMKKKGYLIKRMQEDGSCLFRAVADQVYGDQEMHESVRNQCMNYIEQNGDYFSQYMTEEVSDYVERKRFLGVQGNHLEIQALSEMYNRPIHIYCYSAEPINIFQGIDKSDHISAPIRLCYHRGVHYNSLVDPHKPTIGVGLGLPNYSPGSADRNLVGQAVKMSEKDVVEKTMLEDKIKATDWEATNEAIEEQVARESYLQWLRDNERRNCSDGSGGGGGGGGGGKIQRSSTSATVTSGELRITDSPSRSPKPSCSSTPSSCCGQKLRHSASPIAGCSSERDSPKPGSSSSQRQGIDGFQLLETATFLNGLPSAMFGLEDWSEADVLTQVLAASQQEYLEELKQKKQKSHTYDESDCGSKEVAKGDTEKSNSTQETTSRSQPVGPTPLRKKSC